MYNNQEFEVEMFRDSHGAWCVILWHYDDVERKHIDLVKEDAEELFLQYCQTYQTARKVKYES
jgi:hypothetical protein